MKRFDVEQNIVLEEIKSGEVARCGSEKKVVRRKKEVTRVMFVSEEIRDSGVTKDECVVALLEKMTELLKAGEKIYIHCWGGHGRTGTIIACLLGYLYPIEPDCALHLTSVYHQLRLSCRGASPQAPSQFDQVRRIVSQFRLRDKKLDGELREKSGEEKENES